MKFVFRILPCVLTLSSCSDSKYKVISKTFDDGYSISVEAERFYENSSGVNVNLEQNGAQLDGPVFIGSIYNSGKINLKAFKYDSLIGVVWEKPTGENMLVYIYSLKNNLGWPGDKEKLSPKQIEDLKDGFISKSLTDIGSVVVLGEIE